MGVRFRDRYSRLFLATMIVVAGCAKSPKGSIEELVKTRQPTIQGQTNINFTTSSPPFTLNCECDPISYAIEWSNNQVAWNTLAGGCPANGTFTMNVTVTGFYHFYVRAKTKTGYTPTSHAFIRLLLPPVSPYFAFVSSGHAGDELATGAATQNAIEHTFLTRTMSNATLILKQSLIDTIYE